MKYKKINYENKILKRISSKKVNNIISHPSKYQGLIIYMLPINANPEAPWMSFFELMIEDIKYMSVSDYINFINECKYYNCNNELGSYLKYYIEEGVI